MIQSLEDSGKSGERGGFFGRKVIKNERGGRGIDMDTSQPIAKGFRNTSGGSEPKGMGDRAMREKSIMLEPLGEEGGGTSDGMSRNAAIVSLREIGDGEGRDRETIKVFKADRCRISDVGEFKADRAFEKGMGVLEGRERGEEVGGHRSHGERGSDRGRGGGGVGMKQGGGQCGQ